MVGFVLFYHQNISCIVMVSQCLEIFFKCQSAYVINYVELISTKDRKGSSSSCFISKGT